MTSDGIHNTGTDGTTTTPGNNLTVSDLLNMNPGRRFNVCTQCLTFWLVLGIFIIVLIKE